MGKQWPLDPLNVVITDILRLDSAAVVADLGCGEARLARSVPNTVHSFDLVAANERVTVADIAHTPLEVASVDVVVFCLSLMGNQHQGLCVRGCEDSESWGEAENR